MIPAPYAAARARQDVLYAEMNAASAAWRSIPGMGSGAMGLTPDAVKFSPPYRAAKSRYDRAHRAVQEFNREFVKVYKREIAAERADRRGRGVL